MRPIASNLKRSAPGSRGNWSRWVTSARAFPSTRASPTPGRSRPERGEVEALANTLVETLTEVEHALEKFDAGTYGVCEICGAPIPDARLEAKPAARQCMECVSARR